MINISRLYNLFTSAFLAGMFISLGCICFLKICGVVGAVLFAFGLLSIVHYKLKLFTGTAGFINNIKDFYDLLLILLFNIIGCFVASIIMKHCEPSLCNNAMSILDKQLEYYPTQSMLMGVFCGIIMTTAVKFAREYKFLPLLFGVPLFILCGFLHCIADAFYYLLVPFNYIADKLFDVLFLYGSIVVGNFIGCNLHRIIKAE